MIIKVMAYRPGWSPAWADSRPNNSSARGARTYSAATTMLNVNSSDKNHRGPDGQNGNAVQCNQNADRLGSAAVAR
jgi:hypothetical protein